MLTYFSFKMHSFRSLSRICFVRSVLYSNCCMFTHENYRSGMNIISSNIDSSFLCWYWRKLLQIICLWPPNYLFGYLTKNLFDHITTCPLLSPLNVKNIILCTIRLIKMHKIKERFIWKPLKTLSTSSYIRQ